MSWFMRMALVYRSEKKKIIRNQLDLIGLLQGIVDSYKSFEEMGEV